MTKKELVSKLTELGYTAEIVNGVPIIYEILFSEAEKIIKELGYIGSYGVKKNRPDRKE